MTYGKIFGLFFLLHQFPPVATEAYILVILCLRFLLSHVKKCPLPSGVKTSIENPVWIPELTKGLAMSKNRTIKDIVHGLYGLYKIC